MENVQKTRRLFASAYGCKASRSFLIWGLSAAMSISVIPMMAEISVGEKNYDTQIVSQTKTITGTIIDETGEPMIGVSVLVQGTTTGAVTDLDGKFTLEVPANATLVVSYIGYKTQNVKVGSQNTFAIKMESDNEVLDEVVVIGYQTIKRKDLTGSVASVSGKTVSVMPVSNVAQAMQGKLPGVNITSQDGRPDAAISIRVRGGGSISQSNEPLILVDGVTVNSLNDIPSDQVESIDVLKDASSTAIYGARGANGVILVTTKGAKEGKVSVSYNGYVKFNTPTKYLETLDPYDYLSFVWGNAAASGDAYRLPFEKLYGIGDYLGSNTEGIESYRNTKNYNIQKDVYNSSVSHNHDLSVSGGTEKTKVLFAMNYMDEQGMKLNSYAKRGGVSLKINQKLRDNLDINLDTRYSDMRTMGDEGTTNGSGSLLSSSYRFRPIATRDILGDLNALREGNMEMYGRQSTWDTYSPVARIGDYDPLYIKQTLRGTLSLNWRLFDGFAYHTDFTLNQSWEQDKIWGGAIYNNYLDDETGVKLYAGNVEYTKRDSWGLRWTNTISYDFNFLPKQHRLNILLGHEVTDSGGSKMSISASHFPSNFTKDNAFAMINQYDVDHGTSKFSSGVDIPGRILSFFGRANYTLMDRYLFTVTFRADGSSKFSPEHRWGYFPAAAFGWRLSEETFMEGTKDWLDNLKVRLSYGTVGNDGISSDLWSQTWTSETDLRYQYILNNQYSSSYDLSTEQMANKNLKWETTITRNFGFDFGFLKNRLWGSLDLYWNTTKDLLMLTSLPGITGFTSTYDNIGQTSNKGIEFSLSGVIFENKDWNITAGMNINFNKGKVDKLAENVTGLYGSSWCGSSSFPGEDYILQEGKPVGMVRGFIYDGFYTTDDFNYVNGQYILKEGVADLGSFINPVHENRLWGSLDLYWNTTKDLLMLTSLPGITGFTSTYDNIGQTSNKGIEFSLSGVIFENKDWNITAGMNINFNKGKVDKLAENVTGLYGSSWCGSSSFPGEDYILQEGKPVGMVRGFIYDGFYTTDDFNYVNGQYILKEGVADLGSFINPVHGVDRPSGQNAYPGLPKFRDMDNSGSIDEKDVTIIGDMNPVHTGGFNINTTYKNFDLGLYFNWSYGNDVYNVNKIASLYGAKEKGVYENKLGFMKDSYKIYDVVDGKLVRLTTPEQLNAANVNANLPLPYSENGVTSSIAIEDGSYLRLNTLTLGYSLPDKVLHKAGLSKLRIYGTIYNLFTLTGYSGLDPEVSANTSQNKAKYPTVGLDWGTYPRARSFVVGLNLAF